MALLVYFTNFDFTVVSLDLALACREFDYKFIHDPTAKANHSRLPTHSPSASFTHYSNPPSTFTKPRHKSAYAHKSTTIVTKLPHF